MMNANDRRPGRWLARLVCAAPLLLAGCALPHFAGLGSYYISGEINSTVKDTQATLERVKTTYADGKQNFRDGITVEYPDWHFNVRPSANDPVVRLNLEAGSQADMERKRDELLTLIRQ